MFDWPTPAALRMLILMVATLAATGVMAWAIASAVNHAQTSAQTASQQGLRQSEQLIAAQQQRTQAALLGECQGRDALTAQVDAAHHVLHHILVEASILTGSARGIGRIGHIRRQLAAEYAASARAIKEVTQTDCGQELAHPLTYPKPTAVPLR